MLLEQLYKVATCRLVQDSARTLSYSFCQKAHNSKNLVGIWGDKDRGNMRQPIVDTFDIRFAQVKFHLIDVKT